MGLFVPKAPTSEVLVPIQAAPGGTERAPRRAASAAGARSTLRRGHGHGEDAAARRGAVRPRQCGTDAAGV